jgi:NADH-quinone oxidoreductase subunit A
MLWPLWAYLLAILFVVAMMLLIPRLIGERHKEPATGEPYEAGMAATGSARARLSVQFYLVAIFFVVFDIEAVFLVAWAVAARQLGWVAFGEVAIFIGILLAALVYLWRMGALDWGTTAKMRARVVRTRETSRDKETRAPPLPLAAEKHAEGPRGLER